jgi:hypothetical protein
MAKKTADDYKGTAIITKSKEDSIAQQAREEYEATLLYKNPRVLDWNKNYDLYALKKMPGPAGRANVNLPIMSGFIDTLESMIDDVPNVKFDPTSEGDLGLSKRITSFFTVDSGPSRGNWAWKDLMVKKNAAFTGRGIVKYFSTNKTTKYFSKLGVVDSYDFLIDPTCGGETEQVAKFLGQDNIFKDKWDLQNSGNTSSQVNKLLSFSTDKDKKDNFDNSLRERASRYTSLGLDIETYAYYVNHSYRLTEWYTTYEGTRYYLLMDMASGIWVKCLPALEMFTVKHPEIGDAYWPFASFAPKTDAFNYWSVAPADDIREINYICNTLVNQALDNRERINYNQRAYDTNVFKDAALLAWRKDGLVPATSTDGNIQNAIYEFKTSEMGIQGSVDLLTWFDRFAGQKTGVNADAQGGSQEDKVGIYFGNLKQIAGRMGLYNKSYANMYVSLGNLYINGLIDHLTEPEAVKIIGEKGVKWDEELKGSDIKDKRFDIVVKGGSDELAIDEGLKRNKVEFLTAEGQSPLVNQKWNIRERMTILGFTESDIAAALNVNSDESQEIISEAANENEMIFRGEEVKPNKGATRGHIQKHVDFASKEDLTKEVYEKIMAHIDAEIPIAVSNTSQELFKEKMAANVPVDPTVAPMEESMPASAMPASTAEVAPNNLV